MKALYNKTTKEVLEWLDSTSNAMGLGPDVGFINLPDVSEEDSKSITNPFSYTHLTLPTIYSV